MFLYIRQSSDCQGQHVFSDEFGHFTLIERSTSAKAEKKFRKLIKKSNNAWYYKQAERDSSDVAFWPSTNFESLDDFWTFIAELEFLRDVTVLVHFADKSKRWFNKDQEDITDQMEAMLKEHYGFTRTHCLSYLLGN